MRKYLIKYQLIGSIYLYACILIAKNKYLARFKFLKSCKHLIQKPIIIFIQEIKNASNN